MMLFDTHAHINDARFDADRDEVASSLIENGVALVIDVACELDDFEKTLALTHKYDNIFGAAGIHPHTATQWTRDPAFAREAVACALKQPKMVALGEIGLDYHYDLSPREEQREAFRAQLELARELDKPVILHVREAFGDAMEILREDSKKHGAIRGVMHCFSGSAEIAKECVSLGLKLGFGGSVTFKNARKLVETAQLTDLTSILIETDCPYLAPVPFRGERNEPKLAVHAAEKLAQIKGVSLETVVKTTMTAGRELFKI